LPLFGDRESEIPGGSGKVRQGSSRFGKLRGSGAGA